MSDTFYWRHSCIWSCVTIGENRPVHMLHAAWCITAVKIVARKTGDGQMAYCTRIGFWISASQGHLSTIKLYQSRYIPGLLVRIKSVLSSNLQKWSHTHKYKTKYVTWWLHKFSKRQSPIGYENLMKKKTEWTQGTEKKRFYFKFSVDLRPQRP